MADRIMDIFRNIAERRINEAISQGEFDNLPGMGKPLYLEDDGLVPEDLRLAYRVLRNAGCLPPELELRNEIVSLRSMIDSLDDDRERMKQIRELNFKMMKLAERMKRPLTLDELPEYRDRVINKLVGT